MPHFSWLCVFVQSVEIIGFQVDSGTESQQELRFLPSPTPVQPNIKQEWTVLCRKPRAGTHPEDRARRTQGGDWLSSEIST
jgi:hypothetical protein